MESALRPREIQSRIRAGQSVDEVAEIAGMPLDRLRTFAGPIIAEREHIASLALATTVRRRGETSAHRNLRTTVAERLLSCSIDADTVDWDAWRLDDGRWSVSAAYRDTDDSEHTAVFLFDLRGKFSVAGNDDARWLLNEQRGGTRRDIKPGDPDDEPTVDLADELALIRATQEERSSTEDAAQHTVQPGGTGQPSGPLLTAVPDVEAPLDLAGGSTIGIGSGPAMDTEQPEPSEPGGDPTDSTAEDDEDFAAGEQTAVADDSALDTLYDLMGGDDDTEDSSQPYAGLSDASAVPEIDSSGWEPALVVDYPVEPGPVEEPEQPALVRLEPEQEAEEVTAAEQEHAPGRQQPGTSAPTKKTPLKQTANKKRAAVPSWDEIMFGGPPREKH